MNNARAGRSGKETEDFPDAISALVRASRKAFASHWKGMKSIKEAAR